MKVSDFHRQLRAQGCEVVRSRGGHQTWRAPNGQQFVTTVPGRRKEVKPGLITAIARILGVEPQELRA